MTGQPLIGVTTYPRDAEERFRVPTAYVDAIRRAGGVPVLLPPGETHLEQLLEDLDGLVLSGGGDIDPDHYGGADHWAIEKVDRVRDETELALARTADRLDYPTLCICRGAQVMNVALGGTLVEHLPDEVGDEVAHRPDGGLEYPRHRVEVTPQSFLANVLGSTDVSPASWHHQAVRELAPGLVTVALAQDGTVEAFEKPDHTWLLGVQWHPEVTANDDPTQQRLFDSLVEAATARRRAR